MNPNIPWDNEASLYRVIGACAEGSGRTVDSNGTWEFDESQIRELAARPEFTPA